MHGTHCKHCSLIPPLVFNNNLTLLRCGYICAGTLVHISRHQGKTSNNNIKRCQLWIHCVLYRVCRYIRVFLLRCTSFTCFLIHLSLMPLGCNLNSCWEVLTPLNLYVQVLKLGLKWSPPPKIKFSSQSRLTNLGSFCTRLFLPACGTFLQLVSILYSYCKFYFCTWLWYTIHVIVYHTLWELCKLYSLSWHVYKYYVLWYCDSCLYWCLAYIRKGTYDLRIYVAVMSPFPRDRGVTGWYQSLGSHTYSTIKQQINGILICNCYAWVSVIQSNYNVQSYLYKVIYSFLTPFLMS